MRKHSGKMKITSEKELSDHLSENLWLHRCQMSQETIKWIEQETINNIIIGKTTTQEGGNMIKRYIKVLDNKYEFEYELFGESIKTDTHDTAIKIKKIGMVEGCKLALFSQFGELSHEEDEISFEYSSEEEEIEKILTKEDFSDYLLNNWEKGFGSDQLSEELVLWLDEETIDNTLIEKDISGPGGYTLWTREIKVNNGTFILNYMTSCSSIEEDWYHVHFEVSKK